MEYRKSQTGWVVIGTTFGTMAFLSVLFDTQWGSHPLPFTPFLLLLLAFLTVVVLFYKLTIVLDKPLLYLIYGIGLIRISFIIDQLIGIRVIKIPWYYGFGIRYTPKGMLFNIQGSRALEIKYIDSGKHKTALIGTPEPHRLKQFIEDRYPVLKQKA